MSRPWIIKLAGPLPDWAHAAHRLSHTTRPTKREALEVAAELNACDKNLLSLGARYIVERQARRTYLIKGSVYHVPHEVGATICNSKTAAGANVTATRSKHKYNSATYSLRMGHGTFDKLGNRRREFRTFRTVTYVGLSPKGKAILQRKQAA